MTADEFARAVRLTGADPDCRTIRACRRTVDGLNVYQAAQLEGVTHPAVYRQLAKLREALTWPVCPTCGLPTD